MAWTNLSFAYGSVLTSTKMTQMYDNFAYGAGSTAPTFVTGTAGVTQVSTDNTTKLATTQYVTTAAATVNANANTKVPVDAGSGGVGSIGFLWMQGANCAEDATYAGSSLFGYGSVSGMGTVRTGTWRNISGRALTSPEAGTFQRIS